MQKVISCSSCHQCLTLLTPCRQQRPGKLKFSGQQQPLFNKSLLQAEARKWPGLELACCIPALLPSKWRLCFQLEKLAGVGVGASSVHFQLFKERVVFVFS